MLDYIIPSSFFKSLGRNSSIAYILDEQEGGKEMLQELQEIKEENGFLFLSLKKKENFDSYIYDQNVCSQRS